MAIDTELGRFYTASEIKRFENKDLHHIRGFYLSQIKLQKRLFELDLTEDEEGRTMSCISRLQREAKIVSDELATRPSHGA